MAARVYNAFVDLGSKIFKNGDHDNLQDMQASDNKFYGLAATGGLMFLAIGELAEGLTKLSLGEEAFAEQELKYPMEAAYANAQLAIKKITDPAWWVGEGVSGSDPFIRNSLEAAILKAILEYREGDEQPIISIQYKYLVPSGDQGWFDFTEPTGVPETGNVDFQISDFKEIAQTAINLVLLKETEEYSGDIQYLKSYLMRYVMPEIFSNKRVVDTIFPAGISDTIWAQLSPSVSAADGGRSYNASLIAFTDRVARSIRELGLEKNTTTPLSTTTREITLNNQQFLRVQTNEIKSEESIFDIVGGDETFDVLREHLNPNSFGMAGDYSLKQLENTWLGSSKPDDPAGPLRFINVQTVVWPTDFVKRAQESIDAHGSNDWEPVHEDLLLFLWGLGEFQFNNDTGDYTSYQFLYQNSILRGFRENFFATWDWFASWWEEEEISLEDAHRLIYGQFLFELINTNLEYEGGNWPSDVTVGSIFEETFFTNAVPKNITNSGVVTAGDGQETYLDSVMTMILNDMEIERRVLKWNKLVEDAQNHTEGDVDGDRDIDLVDVVGIEGINEGLAAASLEGLRDAGLTTPEALEPEDIESRQKFFKQCALMINAHKLKQQLRLRLNREYATSGSPATYKPFDGRFWMGLCESDQERLINNLISSRDGKEFFDLPPAILSYLVPKLRLYKVENAEQGIMTDTEFIFGQHTDLDREKNYSRSEIIQQSNVRIPDSYLKADFDKGDGCGVKEFSFDFDGSTPATSKNDIKAKLVLYFQTFADLIRERISYNGKPYRYIDLIIQPKPNEENKVNNVEIVHPNQYDPTFFRIRAEVGYNPLGPNPPIDYNGWTSEQWENLNNAILRTNRAYYLCQVDHDININNDGTVNVTISYQAYIETALKSLRFDALSTKELVETRKRGQKGLQKLLENPDCTDVQISLYKSTLNAAEDRIRKNSLRSIISRLLLRDKIYGVTVNESDAKSFRSQGYFNSCRITTFAGEDIPDDFDSLSFLDTVDEDSITLATSQILESGIPDDTFNYADESDTTVNFFFFGDLLHTILDTTYDSNGQVTGMENTKFILGSLDFNTFITRKKGEDINSTINIAELPISVDYFMQWFTENILEQGDTRKSFPIIYFVRNLANKLLKNSVLENCVHRKMETKTRFQTGQISAFSPDGSDPFGKLVTRNNWVVNTDLMRSKDKLPLQGDANQELRDLAGPDGLHAYFYNYLVINVVGSSLTYTGRGLYTEDIDDGRYHIDIGSNRGIVKTVKFAKTDIQYQREARFMRQGIDGLQQLANVYKATVEMYGNSLFYPGMEMYINPYGIGGTEFGSPSLGPKSPSGRSLANTLGVGGYHTITSVKSSITPGKFTTTIQAQWYYSGDGEGNPGNSGNGSNTMISNIVDRSVVPFAEDNACRDIFVELRDNLTNLSQDPSRFIGDIEPSIQNLPPPLVIGESEGSISSDAGSATIITSADDSKYVLAFTDDDGQTYEINYDSLVNREDGSSTEYWLDGQKQAAVTDYEDDQGPYVLLELFSGPDAGKVVRSSAFKAEDVKPGELNDNRDMKNLPDPEETEEQPPEEESRRERRRREREERRREREERENEEAVAAEEAELQAMSDDARRDEDLSNVEDGFGDEYVFQIVGPGVTDRFPSNSVLHIVDAKDKKGFPEKILVYEKHQWESILNGESGITPNQEINLYRLADSAATRELIILANEEITNLGGTRIQYYADSARAYGGSGTGEKPSTGDFPKLPSNNTIVLPRSAGLGALGKSMAFDLQVLHPGGKAGWNTNREDDGDGRWKGFPYYVLNIDFTKLATGTVIYYGTSEYNQIKSDSYVAIRKSDPYDPDGRHKNFNQFEIKKPQPSSLNSGWTMGDIDGLSGNSKFWS